MADDPDSKTEEPTAKRLREAKQKGNVAKSEEVGHWFVLAVATALLIAGRA